MGVEERQHKDLLDMINSMVAKDPDARPSTEQILEALADHGAPMGTLGDYYRMYVTEGKIGSG